MFAGKDSKGEFRWEEWGVEEGSHSFVALLSLFAITELLLFCLQVGVFVRLESKAGNREKKGGHHSFPFVAFLSLFAIISLLLFCWYVCVAPKG